MVHLRTLGDLFTFLTDAEVGLILGIRPELVVGWRTECVQHTGRGVSPVHLLLCLLAGLPDGNMLTLLEQAIGCCRADSDEYTLLSGIPRKLGWIAEAE
jgi:hypothetical protein